jgi:hypothetical protein
MSDRQLAEAWRDLAGWHVGMVCSDEHVLLSVDTDDSTVLFSEIGFTSQDIPVPALDSPANWGHWLAWVAQNSADPGAQLQVFMAGDARARVWDVGAADHRGRAASPSEALLEAFVKASDKQGLPPSVLAWWKSQQGEVSDE